MHIGILVQRIHILANSTREEKRILRYDSYAGSRKVFFILGLVINVQLAPGARLRSVVRLVIVMPNECSPQCF